jgi:hypothetical protein
MHPLFMHLRRMGSLSWVEYQQPLQDVEKIVAVALSLKLKEDHD